MELGELITLYRKQAGMTIDELCEKSGVPKGTIKKIISGITKAPTLENVRSIAYALGKKLSDFDVSEEHTFLDPNETKMLNKYRALDVRGKETVNEVLDVQYRFSKQSGEEAQGAENDSKKNNDVNLCDENNVDVDMSEELAYFVVPFYSMPVSAGTGAFSEFECPEDMLLKKRPPRGTSFVVPVSGDSMEPDYYDGDKVFVHSQLEIEPGQTGVFLMDGQQWIKQLGEGDLISRNPAYPPRPMTDDVRCQGLVLGICDESYIKE